MKEHDAAYYSRYAEALAERFSRGILEELQEYDHFVVWKKTPENKKIPFDPTCNSFARTDDPNTWGNLEQALQALRTGNYHGIGFVFAEDDPFTGIDIDHCVLQKQWADTPGVYTEQATDLLTMFASYGEEFPKDGVHILVKGTVPEGRRKHSVEVYSRDRYFTLTTKYIQGTPKTIEERQFQLDQLYASLLPQQDRRHIIPQQEYQIFVSDEVVLQEKAFKAKNGAAVQRLYNGDIAGFQSKSHADWQLILWLLYYSNDDVAQVRRLFLQSGLVDEKTLSARGESTYLDMTIANALRKRHK